MAEQAEVEILKEETTEEVKDTSLSDIFNDDEVEVKAETEVPPEKVETKVEAKTETKPEKGEVKPIVKEDEVNKEGKTIENTVESPSTEVDGLTLALAAEQAKLLKLQLSKTRQARRELQGEEPETKAPDPIEDPEGYKDYISESTGNDLQQAKITLSRTVVMSVKDDYAEKEKVFMNLVGFEDDEGKFKITDPSLHGKFLSSDNPALFAYDFASKHMEMERVTDPKFVEKMREDIRAELKKEMEDTSLKASEVPDLTTATASGSNTGDSVKEQGLKDIFVDDPLQESDV